MTLKTVTDLKGRSKKKVQIHTVEMMEDKKVAEV